MAGRVAVVVAWGLAASLALACGTGAGREATDVPADAAGDDHPPGETAPTDVDPDAAPADVAPGDVPAGDVAPPDAPPSLDVPPSPLLPPLPLRAEGRCIVDAQGARVRLQGVNWNGGHQEAFVPTGLDRQAPAAIAARLRQMGFNSVRLTYSDRMVRDNPVPAGEALAANPDLQGRPALDAFDAVVAALASEGLLVLLNNHMSDAAWCCSLTDGNALWYNERHPEEEWIANWVALARRYRHVPAVVAADLRNEPRFPAQWGAGGGAELDWPSAAERCAAAILAENPDLLVIVEGVDFANTLSGAAARPIVLPVDGRLVYSAHDYPWDLPGQAPDYETYREMVDAAWGFLLDGPAPRPVWVGEFGTGHDALASNWWTWFTRYVRERDLDWSLWLIFADPGSTWGLLDPATLEPASGAFWAALQALMAPPRAVP